MESRPAFVDEQLVGAFYTPAEQQSAAQKQILEISDQLIAELLAADTWVFGVPMYNFSVPAVFKAYVDQIVRVGKTFSYATGKPEGLFRNKKLYVVTASGADYSSGPYSEMDFVEPYIRAIFGFLGITDITFIKANGTDEATVKRTSEEARHEIDRGLAAKALV